QGYYKQIKRIEQVELEERVILDLIENKRKLWKKGSGRNLHASLREEFKQHGIKLGRDRFFDLLRRNGLLVKPRRRKTSTTNSYHQYHKYPNLIKDIEITRVNQVVVTDITYLYLRDSDSFAYLYLVTDYFSRKIMGFNISEDLRAISAVKALKMAIKNMSDVDNCIHHSDRGIQYCSKEYTAILHRKKIKLSMTENSDPLENAVAERINKTVKEEFTEEKQISFSNFREAKIVMAQIVKFYNDERPHRTLEFYTPSIAYQMNRELKRKWKNYYKKHKVLTE
ncbi:MAG: IS3 family transposase, partial [Melioribacteraceae bacterium]|nr:IS3 family transposase [Melioribacteraceae bacterium]